jgi:hypothetical protein
MMSHCDKNDIAQSQSSWWYTKCSKIFVNIHIYTQMMIVVFQKNVEHVAGEPQVVWLVITITFASAWSVQIPAPVWQTKASHGVIGHVDIRSFEDFWWRESDTEQDLKLAREETTVCSIRILEQHILNCKRCKPKNTNSRSCKFSTDDVSQI